LIAFEQRRIGLEQEFFLVDEEGVLSNRADEFLDECREAARAAGRDSESFAPECAKSMVEVNTPPVHSLEELAREYLTSLELALGAGRELGLRLYPLATYPLRVEPEIRNDLHYQLQARTVGQERFAHAGRCAGVHLHLEAPEAIDPQTGVSHDTPEAAREELLNLYNLATGLDPALVALARSSSFYEGTNYGVAARTVFYRGDPDLFPDGLYSRLEPVGCLLPYAGSIKELVEQQFARYHAWLAALDRAGVERRLFFETGGSLLRASWNPVRLNPRGTVELRNIDSNYPETVLATGALVSAAVDRVRREHLTVLPQDDLRVFKVAGDKLFVPGFGHLSVGLFRAAVTEGVESHAIVSYLDSVLHFANAGAKAGSGEENGFETLRPDGRYRTTEAEVLRSFSSPVSTVTKEKGLELVREACTELETWVVSPPYQLEATKVTRAGESGD
jgi:gamma-glutamyl:cysteine ligase YbdK (ATP-grasp superfamily)